MPRQPRIGIPVPTSTDAPYNQRSWIEYAQAVRLGGGDPVEIPLDLNGRTLDTVTRGCDGFCLPGSPADLNPARYGAAADPATAPADSAREEVDFALLEHALGRSKPVLGICYGLQSMNVWRGGSLIQDLCPVPVNHSAGRPVAVAHTVLVPVASGLGGLFEGANAGTEEGFQRVSINSSHHQAVRSPGEGLRVAARSPEDGVIEALENDPSAGDLAGGWLLGVQWHPERNVAQEASSCRLFQELVRRAWKHAELKAES